MCWSHTVLCYAKLNGLNGPAWRGVLRSLRYLLVFIPSVSPHLSASVFVENTAIQA
jgi:hypothetical protein